MTLQTLITASAAGLAALHFLRGAILDLRQSPKGGCGTCASGGCPAARRD